MVGRSASGQDESQSTSPNRLGSCGREEKTENSSFSFPSRVESPWPGYIVVSSGKTKILLVMDSMISFRSAGDLVFPGPPGKIVSPEIRRSEERRVGKEC